MSSRPLVSVIIPVFDDAIGLRRCLHALRAQTYPMQFMEVIVVDNGSSDDPGSVVEGFEFTKVLLEEKKGSYAARNQGLSEARGDVIAFTDADCRPDERWIESAVRFFDENPSCSYLAGRIELEYLDRNRLTAAESYEFLHAFRQKGFIEHVGFGATANLFIRREVLDRVGRFDESLRSAGDLEFGRRVGGAGFGRAYSDDIVIRHDARHRFRDLRNRELRKVDGLFSILRSTRGTAFAIVVILLMPSWKIARDGTRSCRLRSVRELVLYGLTTIALRLGRARELVRLLLGGEARR